MIQFYSTNKRTPLTSLKEAVFQGLAPDGGLFMPETISPLPPTFFQSLPTLSFQEIGFQVAQHLLQGAIPSSLLRSIVDESLTFDAPLIPLSDTLYVLELFHGPTLSFKDFGARFMARLLYALLQKEKEKENDHKDVHVLVATSGDTGSAVAHGFLNLPGIRVVVLYPKGQVSHIQEQQLTTMGNNVTALEIEGTFDDCQALVKQAFHDPDLAKKLRLTSANSINIARLIPQSFYYFYAYAQLKGRLKPIVVSVPSGNFGNLTAGLLAKKMGLPIDHFIAATNINDPVPKYLETGKFHPQASKRTLSNAMDVGNPSNFDRILDLYQGDLGKIRQDITGASFTDEQTLEAIGEIERDYGYLADPHGAVAYLGLMKEKSKKFVPEPMPEKFVPVPVPAPEKTRKSSILSGTGTGTNFLPGIDGTANKEFIGIFLETAHPAKFLETVASVVSKQVEIPERLQQALKKKKTAVLLPKDFASFKDYLTNSSCSQQSK